MWVATASFPLLITRFLGGSIARYLVLSINSTRIVSQTSVKPPKERRLPARQNASSAEVASDAQSREV